ncbi:nucleoredoxin isoform X2 [Columba livia]|uniref:nucleoredoxin isoform X2 n=1 Tax=Columba livia TaxID=8932 RepID=UPI0031BA216B
MPPRPVSPVPRRLRPPRVGAERGSPRLGVAVLGKGGRSGPSGQRGGPRGTWLLRAQIADRTLPRSPREGGLGEGTQGAVGSINRARASGAGARLGWSCWRSCQLKLWNKYRVSNVPSLIFIDAATGKVVCRNGLLVIRDDPEGLEFPWGPKPFSEVVAGPLLRNNGQTLDSSALEGSHVGVYFSAHWCPPCRSLTRVLVESYQKIKEAGQKFEILFVSADRSEDSFKQYFSEMPWVAVPYADEARRSRLNRLYGIQGIPTLIVLDPKGEVITRQGRVEVLNDVECREFPWHPKPVLELTDSNAVQLNEGPCLVLFVDSEDDGESEAAKQLIQPIAEKIIAKYKAKEEEAPLLFFVAGEDDMTDSLRDYTNLPEAAPLLTILDMSARAKYVMDVEEITPEIVEAFVSDFLADKLKPEPI